MDSESNVNEIELKFSSDLPFVFDDQQNAEDLENTYYLELEGEIDLGLREDTDYILIKTEDNEFKFCEVKADENSVDFHLHSPKSKIAINDSNATKLLSEESQKNINLAQESGRIPPSQSRFLGSKEIPALPDIPDRPDSRTGIMYNMQQSGPFSTYAEINSLQQDHIPYRIQTDLTPPAPQTFQTISGSQVLPKAHQTIQPISHLYGDLKLKYIPPRKRGRPRKYNSHMLLPEGIQSSALNYNIQRNKSFENTRSPLRTLENIPNKFYPMGNFGNGCQVSNYREYQKIQDKNRRQRIKAACQTFRASVPGISRRTDSTSVWEQSVRYISFIKQHIGDKYDMEFLGYTHK